MNSFLEIVESSCISIATAGHVCAIERSYSHPLFHFMKSSQTYLRDGCNALVQQICK